MTAIDRLLSDQLQLVIATAVIFASLAAHFTVEVRKWRRLRRDERRIIAVVASARPDEVAEWLPADSLAIAGGKVRVRT